jgi:hypothetical protein
MKGEVLMVVPENSDVFQATLGLLRFLGGEEGVRYRNFSLPEEGCLRLFLGKCLPEAEIREEPKTIHINAEVVMELWSKSRDEDSEKNGPFSIVLSCVGGPRL